MSASPDTVYYKKMIYPRLSTFKNKETKTKNKRNFCEAVLGHSVTLS